MRIHLMAILAGFLLDLCLGDPYGLPHPVRAIGRWITGLEHKL
ncbi:MAG: cobalamin biosynthesis protein CobD, partial [Clostridium sp.]